MKFVKVVPVYPKQVAIQTETGLSNTVSETEAHTLEPMIEELCLARNLRGYIDLRGQFVRIDT